MSVDVLDFFELVDGREFTLLALCWSRKDRTETRVTTAARYAGCLRFIAPSPRQLEP